ncbi:YidC/Oxa1 family membrane protein insertase [Desulfosporosinus hippei]|uniref:YidC/Oxa1 family membrane protein insertase n=1 Tax=Desulfosporosinus hippei DSM 8344 TaxID=1121419 RepID=A0A1G8KPA9_9FIRM|nr:membrane protein insertase YidC [Desulfosporosinus hippei]SDI45248.1 YidC/Oxa1 family membrane protein insertase [Desulfosporosinus hippei DSM 8344]
MYIFASTFTHLLSNLITVTGDWFIAVALITLSIKLLLFPLSVKQHRTQLLTANHNRAKAMLTRKFHSQTEKVNSELIKIASKYKINPMSSILTLLVQAPVFFSLYFSVINLSTSVGSILVPWVSSLHTIDNLHVLPIVAGLFQGLSGISTENRNLLMFILPATIGVVFLWKAPVALSAYWIVNSALRLVEIKIFSLKPIQQRLFNIPSPEEMVKGI